MSEQQYTQTEEYAECLEYLVEEIGVEYGEAEVCLRDGDLWPLIHPGCLHPFEGEEAVPQWKDAADKLHTLATSTLNGELFDNPALAQSFLEGAERAEAQLKRARERARSREA